MFMWYYGPAAPISDSDSRWLWVSLVLWIVVFFPAWGLTGSPIIAGVIYFGLMFALYLWRFMLLLAGVGGLYLLLANTALPAQQAFGICLIAGLAGVLFLLSLAVTR